METMESISWIISNSKARSRGKRSGGRKKAAMRTTGTANQQIILCSFLSLVRFSNISIIISK
jgi:hypothetical protein